MTLVSVTAYHSFGGEVEASNTPTIRRLTPSRRHQLSLIALDQAFKNGSATGTAQTRYIHPDHLGSTNVMTNASGTPVQTLDFYPYGATRINSIVSGADSARKYIV